MKNSLKCLMVCWLCAVAQSAEVSVQGGGLTDWPRWRGPHDDGCAPAGTYPTSWDATSNILWKVPLPGNGCSTPIVWKQRIYVTSPLEGKDALLALDADGKILWQTSFGAEIPGKHRSGSSCNPSPITAGDGVFVYYKSGTLAAVEFDGKIRWQTNLQTRWGKLVLYWDLGTSPVLTEKDVVVAVMHGGDSYIVAFDQRNGDVRWKVARNYKTPTEGDHSYTTPLVIRYQGAEALLVLGGERLTIHSASDGRILWSCGDFNPEAKINWVPVASPVLDGDIALVPYGRGKFMHGIRLAGEGDVTATQRIWKREIAAPFSSTSVVAGGRLYSVSERGEITCVATSSGELKWSGKLPKHATAYYASPLLADGKLYCIREDGTVFVVRADGTFEVLAEIALGERMIASPVPTANRLLLRGAKHLLCVGTQYATAPAEGKPTQ